MNFIKLKDGSVVATTEQHKVNDVVLTMDVKTADVGFEKHVPFIENIKGVIHARTGKDVMHPATVEHHMVWFKLVADNNLIETIKLNPTDQPQVIFKTHIGNKHCEVYVYCNIHGVWKGVI